MRITTITNAMVGTRKRMVVLLLLAVVVLVPLLAMLTAGPAQAESCSDSDEGCGYSFYGLSSNISAYFSNANSPDSDDVGGPFTEHPNWVELTASPAEAGAVLGYVDPDFSFSLDWLSSKLSGSSGAQSYDSLVAGEKGKTDSETVATDAYEGLYDYGYFGATLRELGMDGATSGMGLGFIRVISGGLILFFYMLCVAVDLLFGAILKLLVSLNPFAWFYSAWAAINPEFANGMVGGNTSAGSGPLSGLSNFIGQWYGWLNNLAWTVMVPLFLAVFIMAMLMFKKLDRGSAIRKMIVRVMYIGLGLPLLGSMYTSVITNMADSYKSGDNGAGSVVLSTYVDFENWAMRTRLYIPEKAEVAWDFDTDGPSAEASYKARSTALAINGLTHPDLASIEDSGISGEDDSWSENVVDTSETETGGQVKIIMGVMGRYITSQTIEGSAFETASKAWLTDYTGTDEDRKERVRNWFEAYSDKDLSGNNGEGDDSDVGPNANPVIAIDGGGLSSDHQGETDGIKRFHTAADAEQRCGAAIATDDGDTRECALSPLAIYNYLNTSFHTDSFTVYSPNKATSGFTREQHSAVTQVGTGPAGFLYWTNALVVLFSLAIIGLAYGLGMLIGSIRRGLQMISAVPFATLGFLGGIAKVIIYSLMMMIEVLGTLFLYMFVSRMVVTLPTVLETPLATALSGSPNTIKAGVAYLVPMLSIVLFVMFTIMALRLRKTALKAAEEASTKLIDKFVGVDAPPAAGGGLGKALAGGAGTGLGHGLANRALGGGKGPSGSKLSAGSTNAGGSNTGKLGQQARPHGPGKTAGELGPGKGEPGQGSSGSPGDSPDGGGSPMLIGGSKNALLTSKSDKEIAQSLKSDGKGLSRPEAGSGSSRGAQAGPGGSGIKTSGGTGQPGKNGTKAVPAKKLSPNAAPSGGAGVKAGSQAPSKTLGKNGTGVGGAGGTQQPQPRKAQQVKAQPVKAGSSRSSIPDKTPSIGGSGGGQQAQPQPSAQQRQPAPAQQPAQPARQVRGENTQRAQRQAAQRPSTQPVKSPTKE